MRLLLIALAAAASSSAAAVEVTAVIRDFREDHPDFEGETGNDLEIVADELGADRKPVYAGGNDGTRTTQGPGSFNQWYRDVDGVNRSTTIRLPLTERDDGTLTFESDAFFPIDDQLQGNEGNAHNYHFTTEVHLRFTYRGGETFQFDGDDDVYVFINGKKALDLGGVHGEQSGSVDLDDEAGRLGITPGNSYALDLFHAERHLVDSNFKLTTTLELEDDDGGEDGEEGEGEEGEGEDGDGGEDLPVDNNGDGIPDDEQDVPGDGFNDVPDADGDGVPDGCSFDLEGGLFCPPGLFPDSDGDGFPDAVDEDRDGDGVDNDEDDDQDGDGQADVEDDDLDGDGVANVVDQDVDGDGVRNTEDDTPAGSFASPDAEAEEEGGVGDVDVPSEGCGCASTSVHGSIGAVLLLLRRRRRTP